MSEHALLSPSSASRWIRCPGSVALESAFPNTTNDSAEYGTACHELAAWALTQEKRCEDFLGKVTSNGTEVVKKMTDMTQEYVERLLEYAEGHSLLVETRVDFSNYIGVDNSFGTSDAIIVTADGKELIVGDFKTGYHLVEAEENEQLMLYALGALNAIENPDAIERVRCVIFQPSQNHLDEWDCDIAHLVAFAEKAKLSAQRAVIYLNDGPEDSRLGPDPVITPGEIQCQWCRARATCPALAAKVIEIAGAGFEDLTKMENADSLLPTDTAQLSLKMNAVGILELFCKAIRGEVERVLFAGHPVADWKLVQGKQGNRSWVDEDEAETQLKAMRLKKEEMYDMSVISPTTAEKRLAKAKPRQWQKLRALITRQDGKVGVAHVSDKRPAISVTPVIEGFADEDGNDLV